MKKIFLLLALLATGLNLSAGPIGEMRARQIAEAFFATSATRSAGALELEWAGDNISVPTTRAGSDNALLYIYTRGTSDGFVIVAGDDNIAPIIGYSFDTTFDSENMAEATEAIINAWAEQVGAARAGNIPANTTAATRYSTELLYDTALWNQYEPYNLEAPKVDGDKSVTGCVATAMSIICYYNKWPEKGVGTTPAYSYYDSYNHTHSVAANTLGRTYDYANMLFDYSNGYTTAQGEAVAALMKDMGTAVKMNYHPEGSGALDFDVVTAFINHFSYSKQTTLVSRNGYTATEWHNTMRTNLKQYGPTYFSGMSNRGGHAFVVDGYASDDYFHFNFGWGGVGNGFFRMPEIEYYADQMTLLYLEPDKDGSSKYRDNLQLYAFEPPSGDMMRGITSLAKKHTANETFQVMIGGYLNCGARAFNGEIALVQCDKDGEWKQKLFSTNVAGLSIMSYNYYNYYVDVTISNIEEGDVMRLYFKSDDSDEWQWAKAYSAEALNEILLCAPPEQVAENLKFLYSKTENKIYLLAPHAYQIDFDNGTGSGSFTGYTQSAIPSSMLGKGEHTIKVSFSGEPYVLKLKL